VKQRKSGLPKKRKAKGSTSRTSSSTTGRRDGSHSPKTKTYGTSTVQALKSKASRRRPARTRTAQARVFAEPDEAERYIAEVLSRELSPEYARAVAVQFVLYCDSTYEADAASDVWPREAPKHGEVHIGGPLGFEAPWTVRDEDLRELKEIAAAATLLAASQPDHARAAVTLAMSALYVVWRFRRKGVAIDPLQRDVLLALRHGGPMTIDALAEATAALRDWKRADVETALKELGAMRLKDGTVVALVHVAHDSRWSTDARGLWELPRGVFM
jgi:hypothetical protein